MSNPTTPARRHLASGAALVCGVAALTVSLGVPSQAARLITGQDIKNDSVTGKDIRENTLKGVLKTNQVAAFGAAESAFVDDFTGSNVALVSKSFSTPKAGFLHVTGAVSAEDDASLAGDGRLTYNLRLDGQVLTGGLHELDYDDVAGGDSGAITGVVPVSKGPHTISLIASESGSGSFVTASEVSAIYAPSGSGFTPPARPAAPRPQG